MGQVASCSGQLYSVPGRWLSHQGQSIRQNGIACCFFAKGSVLMELRLRGVSKSSNGVAMRAASSLRAGITTLYRRTDLAPAVLIVAGISFLAHVLVGDNYGYF